MEGASCGCEICILEWVLARRSVCRAAIGICEEWRRNRRNDITLREQLKKLLMNEFEMTYMGLLHYFFGIEVKPTNEEIVISQQKYAKELLNEFRTDTATPFITPIEFWLVIGDNDWGGDTDDSKSISGYVFNIGSRAVSWISKRQTVVALSTTQAEYISYMQLDVKHFG
ncbi:hypothetical protein CK203_037065 [Vitis vinifera]|uniref:Reverse transcriptase Ty1/copia-type domain-containing protein n=1 Tax=Vitis vinifera TaxID=29760 RepID=A0A438I5R8_VITVI|nr:hypothetical protein CK203_037065 [Vitis vinifera]